MEVIIELITIEVLEKNGFMAEWIDRDERFMYIKNIDDLGVEILFDGDTMFLNCNKSFSLKCDGKVRISYETYLNEYQNCTYDYIKRKIVEIAKAIDERYNRDLKLTE